MWDTMSSLEVIVRINRFFTPNPLSPWYFILGYNIARTSV